MSGREVVSVFDGVGQKIKALFGKDFGENISFGKEFKETLDKDLASIKEYKKAVTTGKMSPVDASANYMASASTAAKEYIENTDRAKISTNDFANKQIKAEIATISQGKSFKNVASIIKTYNSGVEKLGLNNTQFTESVSEGNQNLGKYLSSVGQGNASVKKYIASLIAAKAATIGLQIVTTMLNAAISLGVSIAIQGVITLIDNLVHREEKLIEKSEEAKDAIQSITDKFEEDSNTVDEVSRRFATLAQKVDDLGKLTQNKGALDTEEYEEFLDLSNQLAGIFPSLIAGYDENGNAILNLSGGIDTIVKSLDDLIERQRQLANQEIIKQLPDLYGGFAVNVSNAKEEVKSAQKELDKLNDASRQLRKNNSEGVVFDKNLHGSITNESGEKIPITFGEYINLLKASGVDYDVSTNKESTNPGYGQAVTQTDTTTVTIIGAVDDKFSSALEEAQEDLSNAKQKLEGELSSIGQHINTWLQGEWNYKQINDNGLQAAVQQMMLSFDPSLLPDTVDSTNWDAVSEWIEDNILIAINNINNKEVTDAISGLFSNDNLSLNEVNSFIDVIKANFKENDPIYLFIKPKIEEMDGYNTYADAVKGKLQDEFDSKVGELSLDELKIASDLEIPPGTLLTWDELIDKIKKAKETSAITVEDFDKLNEKIDNIQKAFETATTAIKEYNESGYLSIDNLQSLLAIGDKYLNLLIDENGQLLTNADAYRTLMQAELDELELQQIKAVLDSIKDLSEEEAQAYATAQALDTKNQSHKQLIQTMIDEAYASAQAKDIAEGTNAHTMALRASLPIMAKRIALIRSASDALDGEKKSTKEALETEKKALESSKKAWENKLSVIENARDSIQSLIDLIIDMITKEKELQKEALQEQKEDFDELIDKRKELLEIAKEENDFNEELSEKQNTVAKNALSAAVASLDDSSAGKKAQKEANDNLDDSRSDLTNYLNDHEYDIRIDKLEKLKETTDEFYDKQIETIDKYLSNERQLYKDACAKIDNDNGTLYKQLLSYVRTYTTQTDSDLQHLWSNAQSALHRYGGEHITVASLMNSLNGQIYNIQDTIDDLSIKINNTSNAIDNISTSLGSNLANGITNAKVSLEEYKKVLAELESHVPKPKWYYQWDGKMYTSDGSKKKEDAIRDIKQQLTNRYGKSSYILDQVASGIKHYAKGTKSARGGLSIIDEEGFGTEAVLPKLDNGRYAMLPQGSSVFTKAMTEELFNFASSPESYLGKAYGSVFKALMNPAMLNNITESIFGKKPNIPMNISAQNTSDTISPTVQIYIQGDATQSTVRALKSEADKIIDRATKNVMNIALKNKRLI